MIFDVLCRGKEISAAAMKEGRSQWLAKLRAILSRSKEERAQAAWDARVAGCCRLNHHDRKERRQHERAVAADLALRR
jgi:tRNA/tmRNA/rRNA uracil-C5-methylase (TrmA/RlmC/RlmD family)